MFAGMPVRIRAGYLSKKEMNGYLIEYRRDHRCPYKVGLKSGAYIFVGKHALLADPDTENLNYLNARKEK